MFDAESQKGKSVFVYVLLILALVLGLAAFSYVKNRRHPVSDQKTDDGSKK